jgi:hypothetical protein
VRSVYQHEVKSGWSSVPTCFGGLVPFRVPRRPAIRRLWQSLRRQISHRLAM